MRLIKTGVIVFAVVFISLAMFLSCENGAEQPYEGTWVATFDDMTVTLILTGSSFTAYVSGDMMAMDAMAAPVVFGMRGPMTITEDTMSATINALGLWMYQEPIDEDDGWLSEGDPYWNYLYNYLYYFDMELTFSATYRIEGDTLYMLWEGEIVEEAFTKQ